ncbi:MAG: glycerol-3-phosphate acyltransferase [Actinomycetota bacterium]
MAQVFRSVVAALAGFLLGNLPSAAIATRLAGGDDPTEAGTGNPGGMNTAHVLGPRWGAAVGVADIAKGVVAARVGGRLAGPVGANVAATAAVVGHCHPVGRVGGKGVATSIGQVIGTAPAYLPLDIAAAAVTSKLPVFRHRTRGATVAASAVWVATTTAWRLRRWPNPGGPAVTWALPAGALVSSAVIALRFRDEAEKVESFNAASVDVSTPEPSEVHV